MNLFYIPDCKDVNVLLTEQEANHCLQVLRMRLNDEIYFTNGKGTLFKGYISTIEKKQCMIKITETIISNIPKSNLHIAIAPPKQAERFEWFLEKATEIGIEQITPIICNRSERITINISRCEKILIAAMKQSLRTYLPILNAAIDFTTFIKTAQATNKFIAHCYHLPRNSITSALNKNSNTIVCIGPEGDFTEQEIKLSLDNAYTPITLGSARLRTETAAIVACSLFNTINDDGNK